MRYLFIWNAARLTLRISLGTAAQRRRDARTAATAGYIQAGYSLLNAPVAARWQRKILDTLATYHEQHRDEPGPGRERLRRMALPMEDEALVLLLIEKMRESGDIHSHHGWLHLPDHKAGFSAEQQAIWQKQSRCLVTSHGGCVTAKETGTDEQAMRLTLRRPSRG